MRLRVLCGALIVTIGAFAATFFFSDKGPYADIRAAESLADAEARCNSVPDLPRSHWPAAMIRAVCADIAPKTLSLEQIRALLDSGDVAKLESTYDSYLRENFSTTDRRDSLRVAFNTPFNRDTEEVIETVRRWRAAAPGSAFALTAEGTYLVAKAAHEREDKRANGTPQSSFANMQDTLMADDRVLNEALAINPRIMPAHAALISSARMRGEDAKLVARGRTALLVDPANRDIFYRLMRAAEPRRGGSMAEMEAIAMQAKAQVAHNPSLQLLEVHVAAYRGIEFYDQHKYREALDAFNQAFATGPDADFMVLAGESASLLNDSETALQVLTQAIRFSPSNATAYTDRAYAWQSKRRIDWAIEDARRACELQPSNVRAQAYLGGVLREKADWAGAEAHLRKALELDPAYEPALLDSSNMYVTQLKMPQKAAPFADRLVESYPRNPRSWLLHYEVVKNSDEARAISDLRKFAELADERDPVQAGELKGIRAYLAHIDGQGRGDSSKKLKH